MARLFTPAQLEPILSVQTLGPLNTLEKPKEKKLLEKYFYFNSNYLDVIESQIMYVAKLGIYETMLFILFLFEINLDQEDCGKGTERWERPPPTFSRVHTCMAKVT